MVPKHQRTAGWLYFPGRLSAVLKGEADEIDDRIQSLHGAMRRCEVLIPIEDIQQLSSFISGLPGWGIKPDSEAAACRGELFKTAASPGSDQAPISPIESVDLKSMPVYLFQLFQRGPDGDAVGGVPTTLDRYFDVGATHEYVGCENPALRFSKRSRATTPAAQRTQ